MNSEATCILSCEWTSTLPSLEIPQLASFCARSSTPPDPYSPECTLPDTTSSSTKLVHQVSCQAMEGLFSARV
jgi:hypothetical protein